MQIYESHKINRKSNLPWWNSDLGLLRVYKLLQSLEAQPSVKMAMWTVKKTYVYVKISRVIKIVGVGKSTKCIIHQVLIVIFISLPNILHHSFTISIVKQYFGVFYIMQIILGGVYTNDIIRKSGIRTVTSAQRYVVLRKIISAILF